MMKFPYFIARRYIKDRKNSKFISFISIISVTGIALGVATLIIALTIIRGFEDSVTSKIINFNSHIQISGFSGKTLDDYNIMLPLLQSKIGKYNAGISPFVTKLVILKKKNRSEGVTVKGILPEYDVSAIQRYMINGNYDIGKNSLFPPLLLGRKLADKMAIKAKDTVSVISIRNEAVPSLNNYPLVTKFIVAGIYESGMAEYDDLFAYCNLNTAQKIFNMGARVSGYDIRLNNIQKIDSIAAKLDGYLRYPYYVRTIYEVFVNIFTWIDLQRKPIPIILGLIIIVAAFNIIGTLLMIVTEKTGSIGLMRSIGATRIQIMQIFLLQGSFLAFRGIIAGNLLAFLLSFLQKEYNLISIPETVYYLSKVPIAIDWQNYLIVSSATFTLCLLVSWIPSYIAARISPVSSLRFD